MAKEIDITNSTAFVQPLGEEFNTETHKLAPYACHISASRGRIHKEESSNNRSSFRRDCDRIIHSTAFRRLEYKTQVFVNHEGDHYRTRLTHTLEVAQIARSISRNLSLSEDLAEAMALAHDLGHTPFGHVGEEALQQASKDLCNFDHNAQSFKIVTELEQKYAAFNGLNLTFETLEGIVKHNGPLTGEHVTGKNKDKPLATNVAEYDEKYDLKLDQFAPAEVQIASFADDIAYNNHDIDDGLRAKLFTVEDVKQLPMVGNMFRELDNEFPNLPPARLIHEANRRMINRMIIDLTRQTVKNIEQYNIQTIDDIRNLGRPLVEFSKNMAANIATIKAFLHENMYEHYKVYRMTNKAKRVIQDLFDILYNQPQCLPAQWYQQVEDVDDNKRAEIVRDFIAGMTDRFAIDEHKRLYDIETKS